MGEGDPIRPRLESHYAQKDFWHQAKQLQVRGEVVFSPNPGWAFTAVRDLINQLFAANVARVCRRD